MVSIQNGCEIFYKAIRVNAHDRQALHCFVTFPIIPGISSNFNLNFLHCDVNEKLICSYHYLAVKDHFFH